MLWTCWGVLVRFPYKAPVYVAPGRALLLQAQIEVKPEERVLLITWDLRRNGGELRLDTNKNPDVNNVQYEVSNVTDAVYGTYVVTVTDTNGDQKSASVEVRKSLNPPQASLSLQCSVVPEGALWDTPRFSWWVNDSIKTTNLSSDGSILHLSGSVDDSYRCVINSSQGTSTVQIIRDREPCPNPPGCSVAVAFAVIEAVVIVILSWPYIKKRFPRKNPSESRDGVSY